MKITFKLIKRTADGKEHIAEYSGMTWPELKGPELLKAIWDIERAINEHTDTRCHIDLREE